MTSVATAPHAFELRSTSITVLSLVLRSASVDTLTADLHAEYGATPGMFEDDLVVLDLSHVGASAEIDFAALAAAVRAIGLLPVGVRGGSAGQQSAARAAGLGDAGEPGESAFAAASVGAASSAATPPGATQPADPQPAPSSEATAAGGAPPQDAASVAMPSDAAGAPPAAAGTPTLVVDRPLRSGQQVYARGGDLVVLAAVNYGAEVIADGHVHVYGPLRGKAIAGAKGDASARIFSTSLQPELLSIAGTYRTSENPLPADVVGRAAQVRLDGERLVFEPIGG